MFRYALTRMDPGYIEKKIGKGTTSPILPRLQQPVFIATDLTIYKEEAILRFMKEQELELGSGEKY